MFMIQTDNSITSIKDNILFININKTECSVTAPLPHRKVNSSAYWYFIKE